MSVADAAKPRLNILLDIRLTVAIAAATILAYCGNYIESDTLNFVLSLVGVQGLAGVRALIDSAGGKTYILASVGAFVIAAFFLSSKFGFVDVEAIKDVANGVLGVVLGGSALTLNHAMKKSGQ